MVGASGAWVWRFEGVKIRRSQILFLSLLLPLTLPRPLRLPPDTGHRTPVIG